MNLERVQTCNIRGKHTIFATICRNNVNRSMKAHIVLQQDGFRVYSYGAGSKVCFPGNTATTNRAFSFSTSYETMLQQLKQIDLETYTQNGVLALLERNLHIKKYPERWQSVRTRHLVEFDVLLCLDYDMFIVVTQDVRCRFRWTRHKKLMHVICMDICDTFADAQVGSKYVLALCREIEELREQSEVQVHELVRRFKQVNRMRRMVYCGIYV